MPHPVFITYHARERWIERIVDPKRYNHLSICKKGCEECCSLASDIRYIIVNYGRNIDIAIKDRFLKAREKVVSNPHFLESIRKQYPGRELTFSVDGNAVFVTTIREGETTPLLLSVLTLDMIDGTILRGVQNKDELKSVFQRWKFEARRR